MLIYDPEFTVQGFLVTSPIINIFISSTSCLLISSKGITLQMYTCDRASNLIFTVVENREVKRHNIIKILDTRGDGFLSYLL